VKFLVRGRLDSRLSWCTDLSSQLALRPKLPRMERFSQEVCILLRWSSILTIPGGSGACTPAYISTPFDALQEQAYKDGTTLFWDFTNTNSTAAVNTLSDACLVFINAFATEGADRPGLHGKSKTIILNLL